jgi:beta-lactam-binding protein with PASTA domain/predicted Ser/Thr protein kinase
MPDVPTDTLIDGRYRVLHRLGAGGMAEVYLAQDSQLGREVALKLLYRRFSEDPDFVERFRREAQSAAGLQHPNVVAVYDRGEWDGTYYIAMEYLRGPSLKQLIRESAPLPALRTIDIAVQILKAARFAHRQGIIHRDLKPHNVIVCDGDHIKVTDFGIARAGASDMTETGSIMGTAQYLSPEQAQGMAVSPASDLYSVGVILYEMLTGHVPFEADSAVTIAIKHVSEAPPPMRQYNPDVPPELEQVVLWALNKDPADRPATADALIDALTAARSAITAGTPSERTASFAAVAAAAVAVEPPVGLADANPESSFVAPPPSGDTPPPEDEEESRRMPWAWIIAGLVVLLIAGGALAYVLTRPAEKTVPSVVNLQVGVAQTLVQNAGLTPNLIYRTSRAANGTVIAQSPLGGVKADSGSTVTLTVSQGLGNTTVPTVVNLPQATATKDLGKHGLKVSQVVQEASSNVATGSVTRTDPASGVSVPVGSQVTLFVSSGKPQVSVPDVTGENQSQATADLHKAGFSVTTSNQESSTATAGNVISQSPSGNSQAATGSSVNIVLATAPTTAKLPDVTGDTASAAQSNLTGAGFKVRTETKNVSSQNQDGIVVSQNPSANTTAKKGSTVVIVVGHFTGTTTTTSTSTSSHSVTTSTTTST